MTDQQLYSAIGLPLLVALTGILANVSYFVFLNGRIQHFDTWLDASMGGLDTKFDVVIGKGLSLTTALPGSKDSSSICVRKRGIIHV